MSEHVLTARLVPAPWTDEHRDLAAQAAELGLPEPTTAEHMETVVAVEDVDGLPLMTETIREAAVSNIAPGRSRLDHNVLRCPGPGRCEAHYSGGHDG